MERRGSENRLRGLRKAAGTTVLAMSLAACGSNNATETQKPTVSPNETPMPTMTFIPSESPMATSTPTLEVTPTPEATPTPTPEATLKPVSTLTEEKHSKVSYTDMSEVAKQVAQEVDLTTVDEFWTDNEVTKALDECKNGKKGTDLPLNVTKFQACKRLAYVMFEGYRELGNEDLYKAAKNVYDYSYNTFPDQRDFLKDYFTQSFS